MNAPADRAIGRGFLMSAGDRGQTVEFRATHRYRSAPGGRSLLVYILLVKCCAGALMADSVKS